MCCRPNVGWVQWLFSTNIRQVGILTWPSCQNISHLWTNRHCFPKHYTLSEYLKTRLVILYSNLYLIHRGITRINFPIIQPVVVVVTSPQVYELNSCLFRYKAETLDWQHFKRELKKVSVPVCEREIFQVVVINWMLYFIGSDFYNVLYICCSVSQVFLSKQVLSEKWK